MLNHISSPNKRELDSESFIEEAKPFLRKESIKLLYSLGISGIITNLTVSLIVALYTITFANSIYVIPWLIITWVTMLIRSILNTAFFRVNTACSYECWKNLFMAGVVVTGALWGVTPILFLPIDNSTHQIFYLVFIAGMSAGALSYLAAIPSIYITYSAITLFPFIIYSLFLGTPLNIIGAMGLVYYLMNVVAVLRVHKVVSSNITMRHSERFLATHLKETISELNQANQTKSLFFSSMSHELRTPLNAILGYTQLMNLQEIQLPHEIQRGIKEIEYAGNHLLDLVNDILDLSKLEAGKMALTEESVWLKDLVQNCVELITPSAQRRSLSISTENRENRIIKVDIKKLKQVIINLLSNAIKYNHDSGWIKILIAPSENGDRDIIRVTNSGSTIEADQFLTLFEPFNRLGAEETAIEGTGLGLYITKQLVEMMNGTIEVQSENDEVTFTVSIPHVRPENSIERNRRIYTDISHPQKITPSDKPYTVLYIEDMRINVSLIESVLEKYRGHVTLETAPNGAAGLEKAIELQPEVILTDIQLPDIDGFQVLQRIRANEELENSAVIALSADNREEIMKKAIDAGFDLFISKPFDIRHILSVLDTASRNRHNLHNHIFKTTEL